ncbi:MAG: hypothetical protein NVS9B3_11430 [Gemmatimonadaceae bacterium]
MNARQQQILATFRDVVRFLRQHPPTAAPPAYTAALSDLRAATRELAAAAAEQRVAIRLRKQETARLRSLHQRLRTQQLQPIARVARALDGAINIPPGIGQLLAAPKKRVRTAFLVIVARTVAEAAAPYVDSLEYNGISRGLLDELKATADTLEATVDSRGGLGGRRAAATAAVRDQIARGRRAVQLLDAHVRPQYSADPVLLHAWSAAKRTHALRGGSSKGRGVRRGSTIPLSSARATSAATDA